MNGRTTASSPDVCIVGGGVVGIFAAYALARRGASVLLLERGKEVGGGCSGGSAGLVCPGHSSPLLARPLLPLARQALRAPRSSLARPYPRRGTGRWFLLAARAAARRDERGERLLRELARAGVEALAELAADGLEFDFRRSGVFDLYETSAAAARGAAAAEANRAAGLTVHEVDVRDVVRAGASASAATWCADDAVVDPARLVATLAAEVRQLGGTIRCGVEARLRRQRRRVAVEVDGAPLAAGTVAIAAGVATAALLRPTGLNIPLAAGIGYHVELAASAGRLPGAPVYIHDSGVVVTPYSDRIRVAGGFDLRAAWYGHPPRRRMWRASSAILGVARRYLELANGAETLWSGARPCTPDGLPLVGRVPGVDGLAISTGHGLLGLTLAPASARQLVDLVESPTNCAEPAFSPARFLGQAEDDQPTDPALEVS